MFIACFNIEDKSWGLSVLALHKYDGTLIFILKIFNISIRHFPNFLVNSLLLYWVVSTPYMFSNGLYLGSYSFYAGMKYKLAIIHLHNKTHRHIVLMILISTYLSLQMRNLSVHVG